MNRIDISEMAEAFNALPTSTGREVAGVSWECPFCRKAVCATAVEHTAHYEWSRDHQRRLRILFLQCPSSGCKEVAIRVRVNMHRIVTAGPKVLHSPERYELPEDIWVRPRVPAIKEFPEYIPEVIRQDYREACLIRTISPKASATLSRRCLQGMIRDFHGVKRKRNLRQEIEAIKNKVDPAVWGAIDSLRKIGNIGAHMEKNVDLMIDVDPDEANKLIKLNELLFKEWYINRAERMKLVQDVADIGKQKQAAKESGTKPTADA